MTSRMDSILTKRKTRFTQRDIARAVLGARSAGFEPTRVEISASGSIILQTARSNPCGGNSWDEVLT